jgi:predicted GNAT family acetyltransferase
MVSMSSAVRNNTALSRFELDMEGDLAFASYRLADGVLAITYVEVPRNLRQQGVGSRLMLGVLEAARAGAQGAPALLVRALRGRVASGVHDVAG